MTTWLKRIVSFYRMITFRPPHDPKTRRQALRFLATADPDQLLKANELMALKTFQRAAKRAPAYQKILREHSVNPGQIRNIQDFLKRVPVLDKQTTFGTHSVPQLCLDGNLDGVKSALTSSGFSGVHSFGVNTERNKKDSPNSIDLGLQYFINADNKKTLLINAIPMGVHIPTRIATVAETSVRADMALGFAKNFSPLYEQTILLGEGSFIKKILEDGRDMGIDWKKLNTYVVVGEEWTGENWRNYMNHLLGNPSFDEKNQRVFVSMGLAECDLNLFHETFETVVIRRLAYQNRKLRYALFGEGTEACPNFFIYYPHRTYMEIADGKQQGETVLTMLSPQMKLPLIRYNTRDVGRVYTRQQVAKILRDHGYSEDLMPKWQLPFYCVYGRGQHVAAQNKKLYPEEVKEALYKDFSFAKAVTGNFKISSVDEKYAFVEIQLKPGIKPSDELVDSFENGLAVYNPLPVKTKLYPYLEFPYGMTLDYERKFTYLDSQPSSAAMNSRHV